MPGLDTVSEPRVKSLVAATGCEYHLTVEPPPGLAFGESVSLLLKAYDETERTCGLSLDTCITWCFHLSDIASQIRPLRKALRRREGCAFVRTLGQPPASGAKLSLTAFHLKSRGAHLAKHAIDDTLFAVRHGVYRTLLSTSRPTAGTGAGQQTREMFVELDRRYASSGLVLPRDLLRTWIYVRDIDNHYQAMADARRRYFAEIGLTEHTHYVASTGIEGKDAKASRLVRMEALAIEGLLPEQIRYLQAPDYLCPTHAYATDRAFGTPGRNATFERGTRVTFGDRTHYHISGTASIDREGKILYPRQLDMQATRTVENIAALLSSGGATLDDLQHFVVYLRDGADYRRATELIDELLPADTPRTIVVGAVCNPAWLIEIDGVAATALGDPRFPPHC